MKAFRVRRRRPRTAQIDSEIDADDLTEWNKTDEKLMQTIKRGSADTVLHLAGKKSLEPTKLDPHRGTTALHVAATKGLTRILDVCLRHSADVNARDVHGRTALHCAVRNAHHEVVEKLLLHEADVNIIDHERWSVLHHACFGGHIGCVQLLLTAGAPVYLKDKWGRSALQHAVWKGQASICRLLLTHGADVNEVDREKRTALMLAGERGNTALCDYLIRNGADVAAVDINGHDAIWHSRHNNNVEAMKLLERASCTELPEDVSQDESDRHEYERVDNRPRKPPRRFIQSPSSSPLPAAGPETSTPVDGEGGAAARRSPEGFEHHLSDQHQPRRVLAEDQSDDDDDDDDDDGGGKGDRIGADLDASTEANSDYCDAAEQLVCDAKNQIGRPSFDVQHEHGLLTETNASKSIHIVESTSSRSPSPDLASASASSAGDEHDSNKSSEVDHEPDSSDDGDDSEEEEVDAEVITEEISSPVSVLETVIVSTADENPAAATTDCKELDVSLELRRLREQVADLEKQKSSFHRELNDLLERAVTVEMERRMLESRYSDEESARLATIDKLSQTLSRLRRLRSNLVEAESSRGADQSSTVMADCRRELDRICEFLEDIDSDRTDVKEIDAQNLDKDARTATEVKEDNAVSEDWIVNLRLENLQLKTRLEEIVVENRNLRVDMESVERLVAESRELKIENEALLREYQDFKLQTLNAKCTECWKLVRDTTQSTATSPADRKQFPETGPAAGMSTLYPAKTCCRIEEEIHQRSDPYPAKLQSVPALAKIFEPCVIDDEGIVCHSTTRTNDKAQRSTESSYCGADGSSGITQEVGLIPVETQRRSMQYSCDNRTETKTETEPDWRRQEHQEWECFDGGRRPSYGELCEEIRQKTAIMQRHLVRNSEFRREFDRLMAENARMVELIVDLRAKMDLKTSQVTSLNRKVTDLERQLIDQIEDVTLALISMMNRNDVQRRRLADDEVFPVSESARPQKTQHKTCKVLWKIGSDSTSVESVNRHDSSGSEPGNDTLKYESVVAAGSVPCDERVRDVFPWNVSDAVAATPIHNSTYVLLSRHYVEDLLAEISALKRTIAEQSTYLHTIDSPNSFRAEQSFIDREHRLSSCVPDEGVECEYQKDIYLDAIKKTSTEQHCRSDCRRQDNETKEEKMPSTVDPDRVIVGEDEPLVRTEVVDTEDPAGGNGGTTQADEETSDESSGMGKFLAHSLAVNHRNTLLPVSYGNAQGWLAERRSSYDEVCVAPFRESNVLFVHNVVWDVQPSRIKRTWSEGDVETMASSSKVARLRPLPDLASGTSRTSDSSEQTSPSVNSPAQHKNSSHKSDVGLQTDATDFQPRLNSDAETVKKYNLLLANLRKTCDLANAFQTGEIGRAITDEDCLSVDELLLLINSHEHLSNEKKILEDENRILGMEVDELASRLLKAEEKTAGRTLTAISEENLEEQLAELEDRLDAKEEELRELREILAENEKARSEKPKSLRQNRKFADDESDFDNSSVDCLGNWTRTIAAEDNRPASPGMNSAALGNRESGDTQRLEHQERWYLERPDVLKPVDASLPYNKTAVDAEAAKDNSPVHSGNDDCLKSEAGHLERDLNSVETLLRAEISKLEMENQRLQAELDRWKRMKQLYGDDIESMFCMQEQLAAEVEELSHRLESTNAELSTKEASYQQLEKAYHLLQQGYNKHQESCENVIGRRSEEIFSVDLDVFQKQLERFRLAQLVSSSNLEDERIRVLLMLEAGGLRTRDADDVLHPVHTGDDREDHDSDDSGVSRRPPIHDLIEPSADGTQMADMADGGDNREMMMMTHNNNIVSAAFRQNHPTMRNGTKQTQDQLDADSTVVTDAGDWASTFSIEAIKGNGMSTTGRRPMARDLLHQLQTQNATLRCFVSLLESTSVSTSSAASESRVLRRVPNLEPISQSELQLLVQLQNQLLEAQLELPSGARWLYVALRTITSLYVGDAAIAKLYSTENEMKYQDVISRYRQHLLAAIQDRLDPSVRAALLSIVELKRSSV